MALNGELRTTVQSSLRKCIDRIWLFCVSPDIPVDRCYPLQLSCDALATGSVKVTGTDEGTSTDILIADCYGYPPCDQVNTPS